MAKLYVRGFNNKISFQKQLGSLVFKNKNCNWSASIFFKFPCPRFDPLDNSPLSVMAAREGVGGGGGEMAVFVVWILQSIQVKRTPQDSIIRRLNP